MYFQPIANHSKNGWTREVARRNVDSKQYRDLKLEWVEVVAGKSSHYVTALHYHSLENVTITLLPLEVDL